jgi:hypothetical protein
VSAALLRFPKFLPAASAAWPISTGTRVAAPSLSLGLSLVA